MTSEGILLGYGNPLLDISVNATEEFLKKYGLDANNAILAEDKHKPIYDDMLATFKDQVDFVPGGATLNALRVAQWLIGKPNSVTFFGCVSKDKYGDILQQKAQEAGVNVRFQYTDKEPTGTCAVVCTGKDRSLVANLAAANCFTEEHLDKVENMSFVEKAKYYYCAGFPLTVCPKAMLKIARHSLEKQKTFCMNLSAPFLCQFFKDPMLQLMPYVDYVFGNENEVEEFAKANEFGTLDHKEIALKIASLPKEGSRPRTVIITEGELPAIVARDGTITEFKATIVPADKIVDTNGAGDAFVGGFLSQLVKGKPLEECMRCAHWSGQFIIQQSGCTFPKTPSYQ
ncbi:adenosine kinase-like isoform X2 [Haliotis rubra]|uniref:adenosine kinase-like isoform X2 n=1 Tax=Haliotis rubra TaxID=36100 RepID=UPI001EE5F04E|nr:adenosine kinase-like isoform X2 [Haliotis rubra]